MLVTLALMDRSYLALIRHSPAWLGPRHGKNKFSLDRDALLCSFLSHEGKHVVLLGMSNINYVTTLLRSSNHGPVMLHVSCRHFCLVFASLTSVTRYAVMRT